MAKSLKLIVEALVFASDKPLSVKDIHAVLPDAALSDIRSALRVLQYEYEALGRSFSLKEVAAGYQFRSRSEYGAHILQMLQSSPTRLSRAAMETLAIIAYKQPIMRQEIERFRGVDVGGILRTLLEKGLIRIVGRKDLPGRPLVYGSTKKFLEVFELKDIKALPKLKEIKALGSDEFEPPPHKEGARPVEKGDETPLEQETESIDQPGLFQDAQSGVNPQGAEENETQTTTGQEAPEDSPDRRNPENALQETDQSGSEPEDVRSGSEPEDTQSRSEPETDQSGSEQEDVWSGSEPETVRSGSEQEDTLSGSEQEDVRSRSEPETIQSGSEPEDTQPEAELEDTHSESETENTRPEPDRDPAD